MLFSRLSVSYLFVPTIISMIPFWIVGMVCAGRAENETGRRPKKWPLLMLSFMISLILFMTFSDLLRAGLEYFFKPVNWSAYSYNNFLKNISARMTIIIIGFPLLAGLWYKATGKKENSDEEKSEVLGRKYFLTVEIFILSLFLIFGSGLLLYFLFNLVLGVTDFEWADLIPGFSYGLTALVTLAFKIWAYKAADRSIEGSVKKPSST